MIGPSGQFRMLEAGTTTLPANAPAGSILAYGAEGEIAAIAQRVALGARELERRAARRKTQRRSRKRNR